MRLIFKIFFVLTLLLSNTFAGYKWPLKPFDQQHNISGTFCENRPSGDVMIDHFHNAIDIPLGEGGEVYAIEAGYVVSIVRTGYSAYIRVGRYNYLHVTPLITLDVNDYVEESQLVGHTNYTNHIHLIDGNYPDYINPLRVDGITPFIDPHLPYVNWVKFYKDKTTTEFRNGKVTGRVDIVARLMDKTDNGPLGTNNGIYLAGFQVFDSSGTVPVSASHTPYRFDVRPSNSYIKNVYFPGSDLSTYLYILTNRVTSNSYWDTGQYETGKYRIKIYTEDTRDNRREFWQSVEVVREDNYAPAKPEITEFSGDNQGGWQLTWQKNDSADVAGYNFYFSLDGHNFNKHEAISGNLTGRDTSYYYSNFGFDYPLYVKLQAYDDAAFQNFSDVSNSYTVKLSSQQTDFLIIDGFSRTDGYWKNQRHDFVSVYAKMLLDSNLTFHSSSIAGIVSGQVSLTDYPNVICFVGDNEVLSEKMQELIKNYLESGANLFICGSGLVSNLIDNGYASLAELYLKSGIISDSSETMILNRPDDSLQAVISNPQQITPACDVLRPGRNTGVLYEFDNGQAGAISYRGRFGSTNHYSNIITAGFPFELLEDAAARERFFSDIVKGLNNKEDVWRPPANYRLVYNYPNPFNSGTKIDYIVPDDVGQQANVRIDIFDVSGRRVKNLVNLKRDPGIYQIVWDGKDSNKLAVSSGLYLCRYNLNSNTDETIKLILLR